MDMTEHLLAQPTWLIAWLMTMGLLHVVAIPFAFEDWRPRIMVVVMVVNILFMSALFEKYGYSRILGLSHVIFWTPLLAYLWKTRNAHPERVWTGRFVKLSIIIILISLIIDYIDVTRYLLGDRGIVGA